MSSNQLSGPSINPWRRPTLFNAVFTGTITLPSTSNLQFQSVSGFVDTILSATATVATLPFEISGTLTGLSVSCNVVPTVGPATFTFSRRTVGVTTPITDGVISIPITASIGDVISVAVSQNFVAGDTLIVTVGGTNTLDGTAHFAGSVDVG